MPRHKTKTSFVKDDPRITGIKHSDEWKANMKQKFTKIRIEVKCDYCGIKLLRLPYQIKNNKYHFCNMICWGKWASTKRTELCGYKLSDKGRKVLEKIWSENGKKTSAKMTINDKNKWIIKMRKSQSIRPTLPEKILQRIINENKLDYKYVGDGKLWIEKINPDFVNINGKKIIIEVFGNYWHNLEKIKIRDEEKNMILKKYGWDRIIIWESELKELTENQIIEKINGK